MSPKARPRFNIGYVRVSTEEQSRDGVSLDVQRERIEAYSIAMDRQLFEILADEGESAKDLKRPAIAKLLDDVRAGRIASVTVHKLDRLTRSVRDLAEILELFTKKDCSLISVSEHLDTSTSIGRLMLNLMTSVAQWEREAIGERTQVALAHKRRNRQAYSPTPYGYRREGTQLVEHPEEQAVIAKMQAMRDSGDSFETIAGELTRLGIPTSRGARWYRSSVRSILTSQIAREKAS